MPGLPLAQRAIAISSAARIGVYDCLYVALAEREQFELVTADDKLIRNHQPSYPFRHGRSMACCTHDRN